MCTAFPWGVFVAGMAAGTWAAIMVGALASLAYRRYYARKTIDKFGRLQ